MLAEPNDLSLLVASLRYTYDHTIAENNSTVAKVVRMKDLESYLRENLLNEVEEISIKYDNLQHFFTVQLDHKFVDKKSENSWKYEIMTANKYNQHERREKKQFLQFKSYVPYNEIVFVIYPLERTYSEITETLTCNILDCLNSFFVPEDQYFIYRSIRNRINAMVQKVYADIWATAELIGSVNKGLANLNSEVVMVIHIPSATFKAGSAFLDDSNWETSPYNLNTLSEHLIKIGMEIIEVIPEANRCLFFDPVTKMNCCINPDVYMIYERDAMISKYLELDVRAKSLVAAVECFVISHGLRKTLFEPSFLSLASYTIMVLRFLMCGLENPVLISLQNPPEDCKSTTCRFNKYNGHTLIKMDNEVREFYIQYHDCFRIKDHITDEYNSADINSDKKLETTIWISKNNDNLGSLLIDFFDFYSVEENYKPVSIINSDGVFLDLKEEDFIHAPVFVQDPFVIKKNIARSCSKRDRKNIITCFTATAKDLKKGISFKTVCQNGTI